MSGCNLFHFNLEDESWSHTESWAVGNAMAPVKCFKIRLRVQELVAGHESKCFLHFCQCENLLVNVRHSLPLPVKGRHVSNIWQGPCLNLSDKHMDLEKLVVIAGGCLSAYCCTFCQANVMELIELSAQNTNFKFSDGLVRKPFWCDNYIIRSPRAVVQIQSCAAKAHINPEASMNCILHHSRTRTRKYSLTISYVKEHHEDSGESWVCTGENCTRVYLGEIWVVSGVYHFCLVANSLASLQPVIM